MINTPWQMGALQLPNRLIQGPLAGVSCSAFRKLVSQYTPPAYCVTEMISAHDVLHKHAVNSRYLHRDPAEGHLCYQLSGTDSLILAEAAAYVESMGADIIDINCGCPKPKIRKKGAGSAMLETPEKLFTIVDAVKKSIRCPLTVKIRLQNSALDLKIAKGLEAHGADAIIVHGRRWVDDYDVPCDWAAISAIKQAVSIPVIVNGDIYDATSLRQALEISQCDAAMISRAGTGKPWLFQALLEGVEKQIDEAEQKALFVQHITALAAFEGERMAVLQSRSFSRYYLQKLSKSYCSTGLQDISDFNGIFNWLNK